MISESLAISIVSAVVGPILVLYIANRIKNSKPKGDRVDKAFEMYEGIIKIKDAENVELKKELSECREYKK